VLLGGLRVGLKPAEQGIPGREAQQKGVIDMLKEVLSKVRPEAVVGWVVFLVGVVVGPPMWLKLTLLSAARILP